MIIKTQHRDYIKTICENDVVLTFFISHPAYSPPNFSVSPPTVRLTDFPPHRLPEFLSPFCISPIIMAFKSDLMAFDFHLFLSKKTLRIARFAFLFIFCHCSSTLTPLSSLFTGCSSGCRPPFTPSFFALRSRKNSFSLNFFLAKSYVCMKFSFEIIYIDLFFVALKKQNFPTSKRKMNTLFFFFFHEKFI